MFDKFNPQESNSAHIKEYLDFYIKQLIGEGLIVAEIIDPLLITNKVGNSEIGSGIRLKLKHQEIIDSLEKEIVRLKNEIDELKSFIINSGA